MAYEGINAELCEYDKMSADELEQSLKAVFFSADQFDDATIDEMEQMIRVLEKKRPLECSVSLQEAWNRFVHLYAEEIGFLVKTD